MRSLLAALLLTFPLAAAATTEIRLWPEQPAAGLPFHVELEGKWPAGCAPQTQDAYVDGQEIVFRLREAKANCVGGPKTPTSLRSAAPGESELIAPSDGVYRVRAVAVPANEFQPSRTLAFGLARIGASPDGSRPEAGFWWPDAHGAFVNSGPGLSAQLEAQGEVLAMTLSGYDEEGRATWWFGANPLGTGISRLDLSALQGGRGPFDSYKAPQDTHAIGQVHIEWLGAARAVFWFVRPDEHGLLVNPVSMVRFAYGILPGPSWLGRWLLLNEQRDGEAQSEVIDFVQHQAIDHGFELIAADERRLTCQDSVPADGLPEYCELDGTAKRAASEFADIGLERLGGTSSDGSVVTAIRVGDR